MSYLIIYIFLLMDDHSISYEHLKTWHHMVLKMVSGLKIDIYTYLIAQKQR